MGKIFLVAAVLFFLIFGIPGTKSWDKLGSKKNYMFIVALLFLTGSIFYLMKMLKIAVVLWLVLFALLWYYVKHKM